jgi:hypothetical protein
MLTFSDTNLDHFVPYLITHDEEQIRLMTVGFDVLTEVVMKSFIF